MMKDMRPISLCSVHYKIVSKILCDRLKPFLNHIISDTQGAFVSGRLITDNIIIAHEMVHGLRTNPLINKDHMAIKTDMSKAYDRVEWSFMETLLEKMGFDRIWCRWVMACVSTVSYSVLLNGREHGFFKPERGIRQGDPLSPFLFILCAEALVSTLNHSERLGRLHGIALASVGPSVHHLLFADDSLIMCQANIQESEEIMRCLKLYGDASGQVINKQKSSIIFGSKVTSQTKFGIKEVLGIDKEGGEGTYLGLPECFSGSKRKLLSFIREKLQTRLHGWYAKALSQGGKEILIKSIGMALPVYAMSVFRLPKDLCKKLTSAMTEFWWSSGNHHRKIPWVAWQKLCKQKEEGGLGFHDIGRFNQALLGKQAWRIWNNPTSLAARVLKSRYFKNTSFLDCGVSTRPSYAWRSILHGRDLLKMGLVKAIGDGQDTNVWAENWIIDTIPKTPMYKQGSTIDLTLKVSDLLLHGNWNSPRIRDTFTAEDAEIILRTRVYQCPRDSFIWGYTKNGVYTSQSGYKFIDRQQAILVPPSAPLPSIEKKLWTDLWKVRTTSKIRHFIWRALSGALAVKERLQTRGIHMDSSCSVCGLAPETICHTLFHCPIAKETWALSRFPLPISGFSENSVFLNMYHLISSSKNRVHNRSISLRFPWILWHIWKARNAIVFEQTRLDPETIHTRASEDADIWLSLNGSTDVNLETAHTPFPNIPRWSTPQGDWLKCNIGASWIDHNQHCGAGWITRNSSGTALFHGRRSFSLNSTAVEAELNAILWAVESMSNMHVKKVIFESNLCLAREVLLQPARFPQFLHIIGPIFRFLEPIDDWSFNITTPSGNEVANCIACSVTIGNRFQSYIACNGPNWLRHMLAYEASPSF